LLNLGHTFGHAIEAAVGFDETVLNHGEAVALGCALAFRYSASQGLCPAEGAARAETAVAAAGLPTRLAQAGAFNAAALVAAMAGDKKAEGGRLTLILARGIGQAFVQKDVDAAAVETFLKGEGAA
jgi:3-dehydroquinate synthase